ncbi:alkaline phosphatase [Sphingobium subterraneum]|uniref:Alkaline phosphatase n=2 Tax=Sphingobium subterraneum TaxID=627688 RepID=A0A841J3E7_9SPHN|nr:alkaline phosphatase [Sphingobium subterraneum]
MAQGNGVADLSQPGGARRNGGDRSNTTRAMMARGDVHNVILMIGDGMGDSEITIARNYAEGAGGSFKGIDALPVTGQYTHYSLNKATGKPDYVTDSAASGTAWATGVKTYDGAIGVDIREMPHPSLLALAIRAGLGTGNITTAEVEDATPAVQLAHVTMRHCYGPEETSKACPTNALEQGGAGSIAEQLLDTRADIVMGGGASTFDQVARAGRWKGKTLAVQARERGYRVVTTQAELDSVTVAERKQPLLGLFTPGNMPVHWKGPLAVYHGNIDLPPVICQPNEARTAAMPTLAAMTRKAIALLKGKPKGFFLQVEGASIDKEDHRANPCGQIGETVAFDEAVQAALEFARKDGHTLVIVTADHAQSSQIIEPDSKVPGLALSLMTKDGALMGVSYATAEKGSQGHTGTQVRVAAFGPGAFRFLGLTDQTDMFYSIKQALRLP